MTTSFKELNTFMRQLSREIAGMLEARMLPEPVWVDPRLQNLTNVIELSAPNFGDDKPRIAIRVHEKDDMRLRVWGQWPRTSTKEYSANQIVKNQCCLIISRLKTSGNIAMAIKKRLLPIYLPAFEEQLERMSNDSIFTYRQMTLGGRLAKDIGALLDPRSGQINTVKRGTAIMVTIDRQGVSILLTAPDDTAIQLCETIGALLNDPERSQPGVK